MNRKSDVIVVGSGMAGLSAAISCAKKGCEVSVISEGMGCLAISGGTIDVLGYDNHGQPLANPWDGFSNLSPDHPYALLGPDYVKNALAGFCSCLEQQGLKMKSSSNDQGEPVNFRMPTIAGTLKPTWLIPEHDDCAAFHNAKKVLVLGVQGFRDCRPKLVISQLRRYPGMADKEFVSRILPPPFSEKGRALNALDLAHVGDRASGRDWFLSHLKGLGQGYDIALMPPMLGTTPDSGLRKSVPEALGCPVLELLSIPPGVGGLRVRRALVNALHGFNCQFYENAQVISAKPNASGSFEVTTHSSGRDMIHSASALIIATGGILSGGILLSAGKAKEAVLGLSLPVPENVEEWTEPEVFGQHALCRFGVKVDAGLRPLGEEGKAVHENVFFAGRTLGGYDYASEKSGHGVAIATGWKAGEMAAQFLNKDVAPAGDEQ